MREGRGRGSEREREGGREGYGERQSLMQWLRRHKHQTLVLPQSASSPLEPSCCLALASRSGAFLGTEAMRHVAEHIAKQDQGLVVTMGRRPC